MTRRIQAARAAAVGAALALTAAACGGGGGSSGGGNAGGGSSGGGNANAQGTKGGTLNILERADYEHLDPQRTYVSNAFVLDSRMLTRTLVTFPSVPGPEGSKIVPDLATDTGRPSNGGKTWTFTLKDGVKFEDGTPITCADVKYGVSRSFSSQITDGPQYPRQFLAVETKNGSPVYKGPYVNGPNGGFDKAIQCPDDKTIVFNLSRVVGDFNQSTAWPVWSPVPKAKDSGTQYDRKVVSTGPYKIDSYVKDKSLTLVRNPNWDPATDTVRKAYPDKVVATFGIQPPVLDSRLIADAPADQTAIQQIPLLPQNISRVLADPRLKSRATIGPDGSAWYTAVNTKKVPNLQVRQAIQAAFNKETFRGASVGGANGGDYASGVIAPNVAGHKDFRVPDVPDQGDPAKADQLLQQSGESLPVKLTLSFDNGTPTGAASAAATQQALQRSKFKVTLNPLNTNVYYTTIGKRDTESELVQVGWSADWPSASTVIPPLFDGRQILPEGNQNYSQLNDPQVNAAMDAANKETDAAKAAAMWGDLDQTIAEKGAYVAAYYRKANFISGSKVKGAFLHSFYGQLDLATLSVQ